MELFDTHAHFEGSDEEIFAALDRAAAAGVSRVMAIGGSAALNRGAEIAAQGRSHVWKALGWDRDLAEQPDLPPIDWTGVRAVGEIGLDYYYGEDSTRPAQRVHFARQLELAREKDLPVVIHTRAADDDTLAILREIPSRGIIHCFTGSPSFCRALLDLGFFISISGIVTFRAADNVRESALVVPDDRLLIETDSPFLAPVPKRGTPNEPAFLVHTARFLAELRKTNLEDFAALTTRNALRVFRIGEFESRQEA